MGTGSALQNLLPGAGALSAVVTLLLYVARLIFKGELVPRKTLEDQQDHYEQNLVREREISEKATADRDRIYEALQKSIQLVEKMSDEQKLTNDILTGLKSANARLLRSKAEGDPRT
jgi:hypothetical protein